MNEQYTANLDERLAPAARLLDAVTRLGLYLSGLSLALILFSYVFEVVMRYFFNAPTSWTHDVIQWLMAATIMLAMPEVTRAKGHIVISFFLEKMDPESRQRLGRVIAVAGCMLCWTAAWICFQETARQYGQNIETMWNHPIPKWWISALIPYGFAFSGLQMMRGGFPNSNR
jgi:TRAP-type C4-dicarboxylate transport system permease small subunit